MKTIKYLLTSLLLLCSMVVHAHDFEVDGIYYNITDAENKTVEVTVAGTNSYTYSGGLVIPGTVTYKGLTYDVTGIKQGTFFMGRITSLTIPKSVVRLEGMFTRWGDPLPVQKLTSIIVEEGNPVYDSRQNCNAIINTATQTLLYGCNNTIIPEGVEVIGYQAFEGCSGLTQIHIPQSVRKIEPYSFPRCAALKAVYIDDLTAWCNIDIQGELLDESEWGLYLNNELVTDLVTPDDISKLSAGAFQNCKSLVSLTIPQGLTQISSTSFEGCSSLERIVVEEGNPMYHSNNNCNAIIETATKGLILGCKNTIIPEDVTFISSHAFDGCSGLTSITIPNHVTSIGNSAFSECSSLTSVEIGNSVTSIGDYAFYDCEALKEVTTLSTIAPTLGNGAFDSSNTPKLNYPENSNYTSWSKYFSNLGYYEDDDEEWWVDDDGNATVICKYSYLEQNTLDGYRGDKIIKTVHINEGFTHIKGVGGDYMYVEKVILPSTTQVIGDYACEGCALTEIYLPEGLKEIGDGAFGGCRLKFVVIPSTVETIGEGVFSSFESDEGGWYDPIVIFKTFTPPHIKGYLGSYNICAPEEGNGYENVSQHFTAGKEYVTGRFSDTGNTIFAFGKIYNMNLSDIGNAFEYDEELGRTPTLNEADAIVFMPEVEGYERIRTMPNLKVVDVVEKSNSNNDSGYSDPFIYTVKGSNCIFWSGDGSLVAGCAASVIPEGTHTIGNDAFRDSGLKKIVIPESVNYIGSNAFQNCNELQEIEIPESVRTVERGAFSGCEGLKNVTLLGGSISQWAFSGCKKMERLTIGKNVQSIANNSFSNCTALKTIVVDAQNANYDSRNDCNAIIETATNKLILASNNGLVPAEVTAIGTGAFSTCPDFDVIVPAVITDVENEAFKGVGRLWFESENPASITGDVFGWGAIYVPSASYDAYVSAPVWSEYKNRIVTPELANKEIEVYSTEGSSGVLNAVGLNEADRVVKLKVKGEINSYDMIVIRDKMPLLNELDLSEAVVVPSSKPFYQDYCTGKNSLAGYAFYDLDKLLTVKLPKDLVTLGNYAFYGCDKLLSVDASSTGELNIGARAFSNCVKLRDFVSPARMSEVGDYAFSGSSQIENIDLRYIAGAIGKNAFEVCGKLKTIDIEAIGGHIGEYAFKNCDALTDVTVGAIGGVLEAKAFGYCPALKHVTFTQGPTRIGTRAFEFSDALESLVIAEGNTEIADEAFKAVKMVPKYSFGFISWEEQVIDRPNLKTVKLPQGTQSIGNRAFSKCVGLSDFSLPQGLTHIGTEAFSECKALETISFPNGITTIPVRVFKGCESLKSVIFPDELTTIDEWAFSNCAFEKMVLPPTLITIRNNAFADCKPLQELHIPSAVENIGSNSFKGCTLLNAIYTYTIEPTNITETTFCTFTTATLYVPMTSFWNYYWDIGWSRFDHKKFQDFNEPYEYFYLNKDYYLNSSTGYIDGKPNADMRPGSGLIVDKDEEGGDDQQNLGDVTIGSDGNGNSGAIIGDENLHIDNLHVKINVKGGRWYFFAFPWDVPLKKISMQKGSDYVFRYYDGEERAKNGNGGWKNVNENHLKAARGYIFQSSADDVLLISIDDVKFKKEDKYNELITHTSDNMNDASWNLMGNPYLSYYDMSAMDYSAPVTVWDGEKYVAIRPGDDDYQFSPYEAFFVQKPEGTESVGFTAEDQMTKTQSETLKAQQAKARLARKVDVQRLLVNLVLEHDSVTDRTRVVFNNRQKMAYETACDAAKFETTGVPQLYTLDDDGVRYAINERPMNDGIVRIGFTASLSGEYTLNAVRMDTEVVLYDAEMNVVHDFKNGAYAFYSDKGTFEDRFTLGVPNNEATGVEEVELEQVVEVIEGGIAFSADATVTIYNAAGVAVATQHGAGTVMLQPGVYVVSVGSKNLKVVVK